MIVPWDKREDVYVQDKKGITFLFRQEDDITPRDLTGYAAWVTFWHLDAAPHIVRAATVDGPNGKVNYELRGDEWDSVGTVMVTATVSNTEYGGSSTGAGFFSGVFEVVTRLVRRRPG